MWVKTWSLLLVATAVSCVEFDIQNHWDGGFNGQITFPVPQDLDGWKIHVIFDQPVASIMSPEADVSPLNDREFILSNKDFNGHEQSGQQLNLNFQGTNTGNIALHACAYIEGIQEGTCTHPSGTLPPAASSTQPAATATATANPTAGVSQSQSPPPSATASTSSSVGSTAANTGGTSGKDYGDALGKSILFYDAQRSGNLPDDNPIPWRGDSALNDCVVGGWYDAGDHVKFGLPFGAATHLLLWGMQLFKDGYQQSGKLDEAYDMIKWATDYMLNAWNPATQELVAQIGDGNADHSFWGRAEDMTMTRPCYKLAPGKPGSDVAGEWAAALAAGSLVFRDKGDTAYADQMLNAAKQIYAFAKANPGTYTSSVPGAGSFYSSSGYQDEMCEGGVWLYRATQDPQYLTDAVANYQAGKPWALSWDDKKAACDLLLYEETNDDQYKNDIEGFFNDWMPGGQVPYTPCGLAWRDKWGANRYAGNSAFLALAAAEAGIDTDAYRKWAVEQINYLLGDNNQDGGCFSFEIGFGSKYPRSPHHRSASCPDIPNPCSDANLHSSSPSPHLLLGGLVGGPDQSGHYVDNREDYVMNEVAIDYNSGFHSALAGIQHLLATSGIPATNNQCPCSS